MRVKGEIKKDYWYENVIKMEKRDLGGKITRDV